MTEVELEFCLQSIVEPKEGMLPVMDAVQRLDAWVKTADGVEPHLRHYLEKRSYAKALAFLRDSSLPHRP